MSSVALRAPQKVLVKHNGVMVEECRLMLRITLANESMGWRLEERRLGDVVKTLPYDLWVQVCDPSGGFIEGKSFSLNKAGLGVLKYTYKYLRDKISSGFLKMYSDVSIILYDGMEDREFTLEQFERDVTLEETTDSIYTRKI